LLNAEPQLGQVAVAAARFAGIVGCAVSNSSSSQEAAVFPPGETGVGAIDEGALFVIAAEPAVAADGVARGICIR
jgi:hypothetical protein